jgi:hypothetical protein
VDPEVPEKLVWVGAPSMFAVMQVVPLLKIKLPAWISDRPECCSKVMDAEIWSQIPVSPRLLWVREVFAGEGGLTKALARLGLPCQSPPWTLPEKRCYIREDDLLQNGVYMD